MIRNINSEYFTANNRLNKNKSNIQDSKPIEISSPLRTSQKFSDLMFSLDDIKSKCKSSIIQFHKSYLKIHQFSQQIFSELQEIDRSANINKIFDHLFNILKSICNKERIQQYKQRTKEQSKGLIFKIRSNESTQLKLIKQQPVYKTKMSKKIDDLQNTLLQTKKELFGLKEQKLYLQKKIVSIIQEYQIRKKFYLAEIKKLTNIVNLSSLDIRSLVLEKTFQRRSMPKYEETQKNICIPFFQTINNKEQLIRMQENDTRRNRTDDNTDTNRYSPKNQGQYNVQIKMLKNLDSIQQMEVTENQMYIR